MVTSHIPVFFIGMMGAGKSHWARQLAAHFGVPFLDTDHIIEQKVGKTIAEIFEEDAGENKFRRYEKLLLEQTKWPERCFVSCGGGLPCFNNNMETLLNIGKVVWLHPGTDELVRRIWQERQKRPLIAGSESIEALRRSLVNMVIQRENIYKRAHIIITTPIPQMNDLLNAIET